MDEKSDLRNGGQILVAALAGNGVDTVYCVPGESYLPVLDALNDHPAIRCIVTRHEGAAANMADAFGKLTGRPGICFVTRGPGASHAANGVHTAAEDSTPLILFIGQADSRYLGRAAFQEVDYRSMFGDIAKAVLQPDSAANLPAVISRAFGLALSGRRGPVVVVLPEDVLYDTARVANLPTVRVPRAAPAGEDVAELRTLLTQARRPLVIVGGSGWGDAACVNLRAFIHAWNLPLAASFRRQDLFDNRDRHYVGQLGLGVSPQLAAHVRDADLLLVIGARLGETTTSGYTLLESPRPGQTLIHIHADPAEPGRTYLADLPINASPPCMAAALAALPADAACPWSAWTGTLRASYEAHSSVPATVPGSVGVDLGKVMGWLDTSLPDDAIIANGAGNYTVWVHRFFRYRGPATELAPVNGAMGYGLPAAIAAKLRYPERTVVCFAGDGCFMMYPQELATAMQYGAAIVIIVVNNGMFGTIRMHQEREFPGRPIATALGNPDFVALARAFGAHAERVERSEDFPAAFGRARQSGVAALLELTVDPRQLTPQLRLPQPPPPPEAA